ncbi:hypothetical protein [Campylobacter sp. CS_ED2]|nr:hypothetical protein [Campylobacter sp. CS_ED2]
MEIVLKFTDCHGGVWLFHNDKYLNNKKTSVLRSGKRLVWV